MTREDYIALERRIPSLESRFQDIDEFGLYLHIPFCRQICPYCPYNKEIYRSEVAERYTKAVIKEIDIYSELIGRRPVTSFYIGGGTPTTMLYSGLDEILDHISGVFNVQCDIHLESHPNDLSLDNLGTILSMGVQHLSTGVEALQDKHLRTLNRPYTVEEAKAAVGRAVSRGFKCVNVDVMFALPGQTCREVEETGHTLVEMGVDQVAAYPLFRFPYTKMGGTAKGSDYTKSGIFQRRRMLSILERIFYDAGFARTSVWAFTRPGVPKYCSVTVPLYVGLGASGSSYLKDVFYLNTFSVAEYIQALGQGRMPIALSLDLSVDMQIAGWLYWRIYETRFEKSDFERRFGQSFDRIYGKYVKPLALLGLLRDDGEQIVLSSRGAYWLHAIEDLFSIDYVSKLWGTSQQEPWPEKVVL
ncbi:MAG: coproporphyrinogen III oxidase family protein [Anaerolineae bacterium]|nr:coproporphyrinogen III oxidase family protein [Anaerolineae bacterium]